MKKYIILLYSLCSFILIVFLLLINCTAGNSRPSGDVNPPNPAYGFDNITRGITQFSSSPRPRGLNQCPLCKSPQVQDLEQRYGTSAPITITNRDAFEDFRLNEPLNSMDDIEDPRVYVKLNKTGSNYYGGDVAILYWDYSRDPSGTRLLGAKLHSGSGNDARYNVWSSKPDQQKYYHGFFQENAGSVILVIDRTTPVVQDLDNPKTNTLYSGSIWTMQFRMTFNKANSCNSKQLYVEHYIERQNNICSGKAPPPPPPFNMYRDCSPSNSFTPLSERNKKCWEFDIGPFDCRTWRSGNQVDTFRTVEPDGDCYTKLGTFQGLDIVKAFGVQDISEIYIHQQ